MRRFTLLTDLATATYYLSVRRYHVVIIIGKKRAPEKAVMVKVMEMGNHFDTTILRVLDLKRSNSLIEEN